MNLTRIAGPESFVRLHLIDSLLPARLIDQPAGRVIDLGSGAGYPGIPLAIVGWDMSLCDSVRKKAAFLRDCVASLGLNVPVIDLRAEIIAERTPGAYGAVIARAVSSLSSLLELSSPLLRDGGLLLAMKGTPSADELNRGRAVCPLTGMTERRAVAYALPGGGESRTLLVYEKTGKPRTALPRRPGLAQRQPLA